MHDFVFSKSIISWWIGNVNKQTKTWPFTPASWKSRWERLFLPLDLRFSATPHCTVYPPQWGQSPWIRLRVMQHFIACKDLLQGWSASYDADNKPWGGRRGPAVITIPTFQCGDWGSERIIRTWTPHLQNQSPQCSFLFSTPATPSGRLGVQNCL